ncbi:hypothetical protein EYF80_066451 [Liparis tanakae]|uniref:Uncharacterized protein n=1 Tax=Liparis tanakae TaxID=230148 RepID=A0A4Z2E3T3_9TELE|nr:hypothetical protein EYF80_066451 [Liparis tanakae]
MTTSGASRGRRPPDPRVAS